ncbi:mitochondrial ribosomal protein s22 [Plakobranchus ocellatus]|uniref:Mitochondrial ribosomal protein s22 n=1 Tax=Plakobranchus ocellatus TaxID=259542 RepID=A0AAV4A6J4_9GAST|nr:mitochondrial ribosomal protein s22 [Plakobranchus ocellatus]
MAASIPFRAQINVSFNFCRKLIKQFAVVRENQICIGINAKGLSTSTTDTTPSPPQSINEGERDPFPIFTEEKVQDLLSKITGFDILKIAGPHKKPLETPKYKLLTDAEFRREMTKAKQRLSKRLQIPPYMNPRKPNITPLSVDPDLAHFDTSSYVFTDVTFGIKDRDRSVVIRETDGTLRTAPWDVKDRMNQIYNPREGKEYLKPQMFQEEHLERMIAEKKYVYILDRACCQFEPDDPDFIRTTHRVYKAVDAAGDHHELRSTKHFGSLAFYLIWYKMADSLLLDMLNRDLASDCQHLVTLYSLLHPSSPCAASLEQLPPDADVAAYVKAYIETTSTLRSELELALQAMEDARKSSNRKVSDAAA